MSKINDIGRWREEINQAEEFREQEFGKFNESERTKAGENVSYFENGFFDVIQSVDADILTTVNIVDALVSLVVPSLYFKNPKSIAIPQKMESEQLAPLAGKTVDHFRHLIKANVTNKKIIWDAYVLGYGVYKIGYATKFGTDIIDEEMERKPKSPIEKGLEVLGLKKPEEVELVYPDVNLRIVSERPFIQYINPFDFIIDPRATSLDDAMYCGHMTRKTLDQLRNNKKYKNTKDLEGNEPNIRTLDWARMPTTHQEAFKTRDLYEIHYRNDNKFYLLVISTKDGSNFEEHYHEESIYEMEDWQFDILRFKDHGHMLYPRSDISKIKPLQDRITRTIDAILEQVDKFVPKLAYNETDVTEEGQRNLKFGGVGALVKTTKNPNEVFKDLNFTQLKADLAALIDQMIGLISIQTGITKAQLVGASQARSATEATIEQGGQTLRLSDMSEKTVDFTNNQSEKLWKIIKQFTPLDQLQLINGSKGVDEKTGITKYEWLTVSSQQAEVLQKAEYDFQIETGSTERVNLAVVRKAFENWFNILAKSDVIALMQAQGKKVDVAEFLRKGLDAFPELGIDSSKIIQNINQETSGLLPPEVLMGGNRGGTTQGSRNNELASQRATPLDTNEIAREAAQV